VNRAFPLTLVVGVSGRLTINRNHFSRRKMTHRTDPAQKALLQLLGVEPSENPTKRIVTGDGAKKVFSQSYLALP